MLATGTTIGRYVVEDHLGDGGMASVYRARLLGPRGFDKEVAVKVLMAKQEDDWQSDLATEARVSARLRHRNIVDVYEFAEVDGTVLIAMELVDGVSLARAMSLGGPPPPSLVAEIGMQACAGLGAAHSASDHGTSLQVIHRDIKPSNLMLSIDGAVKVVDFGIATMAGVSPDPSTDETILGTLTYMSPEQFVSRSVGPQSDLFSMGLVLFAMVRGEPLFGPKQNALTLGTYLSTFIRDRISDLQAEERVPGITPILERALSVPLEDRYASAEEFEDDLDELSRSLPRGPRLRRWVRELVRDASRKPAGYNPSVGSSDLEYLMDAPTLPQAPAAPATAPVPEFPEEQDAFIGRDALLDRLCGELREAGGLWYLYGPHGVGKTRAAQHLLHRLHAESWTDLIWVEAENAQTLDQLISLMGARLGVDLSGCPTEADRIETVSGALAYRDRLIMVIDDISRVADQAIHTLHQWAARHTGIRLVCTSVPSVEVEGLRTVPIAPLDEAAAIELFQARWPDASSHEEQLLRRIVHALDFLPLAIELAAAQAPALGLRALAEDISGAITKEGEALSEMLNWSWSTLRPWEQDALVQCAVFQTPFSGMAAETVIQLGADAPWLQDVLHQLHRNSWLSIQKTTHGERYHVFCSVRAFAMQHLEATGNIDAIRLRHALWMAERGSSASISRVTERTGQNRHEQIRDLALDFVNAMEYAKARKEAALCTQLIVPVQHIIRQSGDLQQQRQLFEDLLRLPTLEPEDKGVVLSYLGDVLVLLGEKEKGIATQREGLTILDPLEPELATSHRMIFAFSLGTAGQFEEAEAEGTRALAQLETHHWPDLEANAFEFMARLCQFTRRREASLKYARMAKRAWTPTSTVPEYAVDYCLGEAECNVLNYARGERWLRSALDAAIRSGAESRAHGYTIALTTPMMELGRIGELVSLLEKVLHRAQRTGHAVYQVYSKAYLAHARFISEGDPEETMRLLDLAHEQAMQIGIGYLTEIVKRSRTLTVLHTALLNDDIETAANLLRDAPIPPEGSFSLVREGHVLSLAYLALLQGELSQAKEHLEAVRARIPVGAEFSSSIRLDLLETWLYAAEGKTWAARKGLDTARTNPGYVSGSLVHLDHLLEVVQAQVEKR